MLLTVVWPSLAQALIEEPLFSFRNRASTSLAIHFQPIIAQHLYQLAHQDFF